jgi:hypothetical protein
MGLKDKIMMSCRSATALVEQKRDRKLDLSEQFGLWLHLSYCGFCALFAEQSKVIDQGARMYAQKVHNEQKAYKLNPLTKEKINKVIHEELREEKNKT